ncbi:GNAT family N-acetyltransferase [Georgenia sp. MJ170]|uniref:GNAT family N-acetyltransferase n=1 Tax=Georgenia sunbinii TaxID=3117728 RepID=UPI002F262B0A
MSWPVTLTDGLVRLRPLRRRDRLAWQRLRRANAGWLRPWEATSPDGELPAPSFVSYVADLNRQARRGGTLPLAIEYRGILVGHIIAGPVFGGALRGTSVGYWVSQRAAGRGIAPTAVALVTDHCFQELGLHRVEINIRPENAASLRVVAKLGFHDEGRRRRYLHIDGDWRDHRTFALLAEDVPRGLLRRYRENVPGTSAQTGGRHPR